MWVRSGTTSSGLLAPSSWSSHGAEAGQDKPEQLRRSHMGAFPEPGQSWARPASTSRSGGPGHAAAAAPAGSPPGPGCARRGPGCRPSCARCPSPAASSSPLGAPARRPGLVAAILSVAAVIFAARKSDVQSFVSVEDFWGGALVGFLIGYSGATVFEGLTGIGSASG